MSFFQKNLKEKKPNVIQIDPHTGITAVDHSDLTQEAIDFVFGSALNAVSPQDELLDGTEGLQKLAADGDWKIEYQPYKGGNTVTSDILYDQHTITIERPVRYDALAAMTGAQLAKAEHKLNNPLADEAELWRVGRNISKSFSIPCKQDHE